MADCHWLPHTQSGFQYCSYALHRFLQAHCLATRSAQPEVFHAMDRLAAVALGVKNEYPPISQVMERLRAIGVRAIVYH
jgi:hypothetical protein